MAFREIQNLDAEKVFRVDDSGRDDSLESISGYYLGFKKVPNNLNPGKENRIHIFSIEGKNIGVWGKTIMDNKLASVPAPSNTDNLSDGKAFMTTVTYTGVRPASKKGHHPAINFNVGYDDANFIRVDSALDTALSTGADETETTETEGEEVATVTPPPAPRSPFTAKPATKDHAAAITRLLNKTRK